jgi:hypothetical protein
MKRIGYGFAIACWSASRVHFCRRHIRGRAESLEDREGHRHVADFDEMHSVGGMQLHVPGGILDRLVVCEHALLHLVHRALDINRAGSERARERESVVAHFLQEAVLGLVRCVVRDRLRADEDAQLSPVALLDDAADAGEIFLLVLLIGLHVSTDVVRPERHDRDCRLARKDEALQPREAARRGVAALARVEKLHAQFREPQQRVVLDDAIVAPRRRDAVAEEDAVAVAQRELCAA